MSPGPGRSVVMVSASFYPYIGGAEKQALELAAVLRARGIRVKVLTRRLPGLAGEEEVRGVPVVRLRCFGRGLLNAATFMASLIAALVREADSYDVIHAHLAGSPAVAAAAAGRVLGKPVLVKLGGTETGVGELAVSARTWAGRMKLWALSRLKPRFVAVTGDLAQEAARFLGPVKVFRLPNGVDLDRYRPAAPEEKPALRAKLGWPSGLVFLYVGRLSPVKRLPWFLETWCRLTKEGPPAAAIFIGAGPEAEVLGETAARLGAGERVRVLAPMKDIAPAYAAADVFVLPSLSEGLSNAMLEAMASGLPVLGSRVGGTAEAVGDGEAGLLFDSGDPEGLARQLRRLIAEPELAGRMGRRAREAALQRYSLANVAERYASLYGELAQAQAQPDQPATER